MLQHQMPALIWHKLIAVVLATAWLITGCAGGSGDAKQDPRPPWVSALGRLEPGRALIDVGAVNGERVAQLMVSEGQQVARGDVLCHLESHDVRLAERDAAAAVLAEARVRLDSETRYCQALVDEGQAAVSRVEVVSPLELEARAARVKVLRSELEQARRDLARVEPLFRDGTLSNEDYEAQTLHVQQAEERLAGAELSHDQYAADSTLRLLEAKAQLSSAQAMLARAPSEIRIDSAERELEVAEARLARSIIRAPIDGQVLRVFVYPGETIGTGPVLQMGDTGAMYAVAEVYQTDIRYVEPGQRAEVSSPALAEHAQGTVEEVGRLIFRNDVLDIDPRADTDSRVVEVRVKLDDSTPVVHLTNLEVQVKIDTGGVPGEARAGALTAAQ